MLFSENSMMMSSYITSTSITSHSCYCLTTTRPTILGLLFPPPPPLEDFSSHSVKATFEASQDPSWLQFHYRLVSYINWAAPKALLAIPTIVVLKHALISTPDAVKRLWRIY